LIESLARLRHAHQTTLEGQLKLPRFYKPQQAFSQSLAWPMKDDAYDVRTANNETVIARLLTRTHTPDARARGLHDIHTGLPRCLLLCAQSSITLRLLAFRRMPARRAHRTCPFAAAAFT